MKADILYPLFKQLHSAAVVKLANEIKELANDPMLDTPPIYTEHAQDYDDFETPADEFIRSDFELIFEGRE